MTPGIMITNGGPHPADKYAAAAAAQVADLIQIEDASESPEARAARKAKPRFELDLADALEAHHLGVQKDERAALIEHGAARYDHPLAFDDATISEALACVTAAASGTPFAAHFSDPRAQDVVRQIIGQHFATAMQVERLHHATLAA